MAEFIPITIANGDGIGPEIMMSVLQILKEAEAAIRIESIEIGEKLYKKHYTFGVTEDTWESIARTKVLLKGPVTIPQGDGYKDLTATLRQALSLYANVRTAVSYYPFVRTTVHPKLNLAIVHADEENLYTGIEYRSTHNVYRALNAISRTNSEKIIRFAFEHALLNGRKQVTCFSKDNIVKLSDGIFHRLFDEIATEYPYIQNNHYNIGVGTSMLVTNPQLFDVIVVSNLYGDMVSDIAAALSGSVRLAGSANIGSDYAMFEAVHGPMLDIAGQNLANPSGLLQAAVMMLVHLNQGKTAALIENAWKKTIEDGIHTIDIFNEATSTEQVNTTEFTRAIIKRLGQQPAVLAVTQYNTDSNISCTEQHEKIYVINNKEQKTLVGVDVFVQMEVKSAHDVADKIQAINLHGLMLHIVLSNGLKLWPRSERFELLSDHWCCRFLAQAKQVIDHSTVAKLLAELSNQGIDFVTVENLYEFDSKHGFALI